MNGHVKVADAVKAAPAGRRRWAIPALAAVLGAAVALAIALPVTLRPRGRAYQPLATADPGDAPLPAGRERTYYLAADTVDWDYAPAGQNVCKGAPFTEENELYTAKGAGRKFKKAVFREYTDWTFSTPKERTAEQKHLGVLGPALHAEVGDTIVLLLRNNAPFPVNAEPGGLAASTPVSLNPGDTLTYRWRVPASAGPADDGPSSRFWLYRSTANIVADTQAGLAGPIVITRPGMLGDDNKPKDVDREIFLMLQVFNENNSPYYDQNMAAAPPGAVAALSPDDLAEANTKYSINGYLWCNTPEMKMRVGETVRWYVSSLGSEDAIHTAHWHGVVFNDSRGHHTDQVTIQSSSLETLTMTADNPGTWLFHCHLNDHMDGGMMSLFTIEGKAPKVVLDGKTRKYYIAAVMDEWDYAPFNGEMCGATLVPFSDNAKTFVEAGPTRIGRKYLKARFVEFTDATFTTRKRIAPEWEHLGVLGPVIRGVVGDTLLVTFKNALPAGAPSVSMHPHGVLYDKSSEGSPYADGLPLAAGDSVAPGAVVTYTWTVPDRSGPGPSDFSSIMWMYHSHVMESRDPHAGLFGALIITRKDLANEDATPKDVDREYVMSFSILDESHSFMLDRNLAKYLPKIAANQSATDWLLEDAGFIESNLKHTINGYLYCNLPGFELMQARPSRIYFMALGGSGDMHTPNSAEAGVYLDGQRRQSVRLLAGTMLTTDISPMVPGHGLLQCHIYDHISAGMSALYRVNATVKLDSPVNAPVRNYYIAAELLDWDYAPLGMDGCTGQPFSPEQETFVKTTNETLGSRYIKAVYRAYNDASFKTRADHDPHLGTLGPTIRAEPGDKIVVHFLNRLPFNASMQMFGGMIPIGNTTAYQINIVDPAAEAEAAAAAGAAAAAAAAAPAAKPAAAAAAPAAKPAAAAPVTAASAAAARPAAAAVTAPTAAAAKPTATITNAAAPAAAAKAPAAANAAAAGPGGRRMLLRASGGTRRLSQITAAQAEAEAVIAQSVSNIYSLGAVAPNGGRTKYEWLVPDSAAPGPADGDVVAFAYVSGVDHIKHINAGLVGAVLIYNKGTMPRGPKAIKELPMLFNIQNEMQSELYEVNLARQRKENPKLNINNQSLTFPESNLMHAINGYLYCNGPTLQLKQGERVRAIPMGFGSEVDMHSPVFAGQAVSYQGAPTYSVGVMPATTFVVELTAGPPGAWDYYCNILDHINAGMKGRLVVG